MNISEQLTQIAYKEAENIELNQQLREIVSPESRNLFDLSVVPLTNEPIPKMANIISVDAKTGSIIVRTEEGYAGNGSVVPKGVVLRDIVSNAQAGKTYWLNAQTKAAQKFMYIYDVASSWYYGTSRTLTEDDLNSRVTFYGYSAMASQEVGDCVISNIMVTETNETQFEPYKPKNTMSLSEGINQLDSDVQNIKMSIEDKGVEVLDTTSLCDYPEKVDDVYKAGQSSMVDESKIIEKSVSGEYISVDDVSEVPHDVKVQLTSGGKNLAKDTFTGNLFVDVNIGSAFYERSDIFSQTIEVLPNTIYTLSGDVSLMNSGHIRIGFSFEYPAVGVVSVGERLTKSLPYTFTTPEDCNYVVLMTGVSTVNEYPNLMLNEGSEALPYEPYKETLTDYSGVSFNKYGKNFFDVDNCTPEISNVVVNERIDNNYILQGAVGANAMAWSAGALKISLQQEKKNIKQMSVSLYVTLLEQGNYSNTIRMFAADKDNNTMLMKDFPLDLNVRTKVTRTFNDMPYNFKSVLFYINNNKVLFELDTLQIEEGDTATEYEPYNGQTLTANADGTVEGVKSISPYMYMTTDNPNCTINAEYHKSYGMQTEYDRFWDSYQDYGKRTDYHGGFYGKGWNKETFKPKYDIIVDGGDRMFMWFNWSNRIFDLKEHLEDLGITLDFSKSVSSCYMPFYRANISRLGTIDISKSSTTSLATFFYYSPIIEIEKFIVNSTQEMSSAFEGMSALEIISFGGTIGGNTNFKWSTKLTKESILSIFNALSATKNGLTLTLSTTAVTNAFGSTTDTEWTNLVATKTNWTISLV